MSWQSRKDTTMQTCNLKIHGLSPGRPDRNKKLSNIVCDEELWLSVTGRLWYVHVRFCKHLETRERVSHGTVHH